MKPGSEEEKPERSWRKDYFAACEVAGQQSWLIVLLIAVATSWLFFPLFSRIGEKSVPTVIVYTSQDQVYAEPILREFTKETGIKVRAVYDSEAVKTVGLVNRLIAERANPQCDVFWNNEELRTRQLAAQNVFRETNGWAAFGARSRRIVINTGFLSVADAPKRLSELTNAVWRGKVALAYPLFGTTATEFLALRQDWGEERWLAWCRALQANQPFLVDGNSVAAKFVARGEAWIGLTDSDDIAAEQREGAHIVALPLTDESLVIPNTVGVIRGVRHPKEAQALFEYLQQPEVTAKLVSARALEALPVDRRQTLGVNWELLLKNLESATETLKRVFLR
jgi:iron(III) transport system substrate-binding protein